MHKKIDIEKLLDPEIIEQAKREIAEGKLISLKTDVGFKLFMAGKTPESKYCLKKFLTAITRREVVDAEVTNSEIYPDFLSAKEARLDVNCIFNDRNHANLEMQVVRREYDQVKRALFYASKLMSSTLSSGESYNEIGEVHQVFDFSVIRDDDFYHRFLFRDGNGRPLSESMQIHFIELKKLKVGEDFENLSDMEFWSIIFRDFDRKDIRERLARAVRYAEEVRMTNANSMNISQDYIDHSIAISREKFIRDNESDVIEATRKGFAQATARLQPVIDEQQAKIAEQERIIAELKLKLGSL